MADLEIYRSGHFAYLRAASKAGEKFVKENFVYGPDFIVQFNPDCIEDMIKTLKVEAEGLDVEVK